MGYKARELCPGADCESLDVAVFRGRGGSLTVVSVSLGCKSKFQSGHLHALIPAANSDFVPLEGISMCERRVWASVSLYCVL